MSTFESINIDLPEILKDITSGKIQLPDFQRGWIWDDEHIKSLLMSIARSFPVGAIMTLNTGGDIQFQIRPIENVKLGSSQQHPEQLILDGQQRLTSLTQVLALTTPVCTLDVKGRRVSRYYYINIAAALEDDSLEEAFLSVPEDRKVKTNFNRDIALDLSKRELEIENFYFPCSQILNFDEWEEALLKYASHKFRDYIEFRKKVLKAFWSYKLPVIKLGKATSKEAVCLVFEKVNTGGVPLSVFELVTASFAADGFNLRDDWFGSEERSVEGRQKRLRQDPMLAKIEPTDFLQAITILHTYQRRQADINAGKQGKEVSAVSAKRASVLALNLDVYQQLAPIVERGFVLAAKFMRKQCFFNDREIPYRTQLVPLATVLSRLDERYLEPKIYDRLSRWFWCGVLGELYGGAVETRMANDFNEVWPWVDSDLDDQTYGTEHGLPRTIVDASFQESRLDSLRSRVSAAYKGLNALVLREGAQDFFWEASIQELSFEEMKLDIHHVFPKAWCKEQNIQYEMYDSIVNKTPISYKANRIIGPKAPSKYLKSLQSYREVYLSDHEMDQIVATHRIPVKHLRSDDFHAFYAGRKKELIKLIEVVMGKTVQRDDQFGSTFQQQVTE